MHVKQWQKRRWAHIAALAAALLAIGGAALLAFRESDPEVVVLMDTTALRGVYDEDNRISGTSNAEKLKEVLQDILSRSQLHNEALTSKWSREAAVAATRPRLVVIHRSSFFHSYNAEYKFGLSNEFAKPTDDPRWISLYQQADDKLISVIGLLGGEVPRTQFLVYSRGTDENWLKEDFRKAWVNGIEARSPKLNGRIQTMVILGGKAGTFSDPETQDLMRKKVKDILHLPH